MPSDPLPPRGPGGPPHDRRTTPPAESLVDESSIESFPASDAPAWTPTSKAPGPPGRADATGDRLRDSLAPWHDRAAALCEAIDARATAAIVRILSDDAWFRFGDADPVIGSEAAARAWAAPAEALASARHSVTSVRADADTVLIETDATYLTTDGRRLHWPEAISLRLRGDRASRVQVYGPLVAVLAAARRAD